MKHIVIAFFVFLSFEGRAQFPNGSHFLYIFDYVVHRDYLSVNHYLNRSGYDYDSYSGSLINGVEGKYTDEKDSTSFWISFENDIKKLRFVRLSTTEARIKELISYFENDLELESVSTEFCNCDYLFKDEKWFYKINGSYLEIE